MAACSRSMVAGADMLLWADWVELVKSMEAKRESSQTSGELGAGWPLSSCGNISLSKYGRVVGSSRAQPQMCPAAFLTVTP